MIKMTLCNMRLTGEYKGYFKQQLENFCNHFDPNEYLAIQFGKQDIRGGFSITFVDHRHCVPSQLGFANKAELLGFIQGFNSAKNKDM